MFRTGDSLSPATAGEERMETPGDVAVMLRLADLGWGLKRIAGELGCSRTTVKRYLRQGGWASRAGVGVGGRRLPGWRAGWPSGFAGTGAMPTWCARSWCASTGFGSVCARSSGRWLICSAICLPRRGRACASRRRPAGSCRSTSARPSCRSAARGCGSTCSWRRWATRAAVSWPRSATSARPLGSRVWRRPSGTLAGCPARSCSTMPSRWSFATMR